MKCPQCAAENIEGKNFCSDCGSLLTPQLMPLIRAQVEEHVREHFKDRTVVDVETTEAIAERFLKWSKWVLVPATILITLLGLTLGIFGVRDFADFHKAAQQAISESNEATKNAQEAKTKAQEAESRASESIKAIGDATAKMNTQLSAAQKLSDNVSGLEKKTAIQIANTSQQVEGRLTELDKKVEEANKIITQQQSKLVSTNELVTAMFSKGQVEYFQTTMGNTPNFVVMPVITSQGINQKGALVFLLLKSVPIFQTLQINARIFVQPKSSYFLRGISLHSFGVIPLKTSSSIRLKFHTFLIPHTRGLFIQNWPSKTAMFLLMGSRFSEIYPMMCFLICRKLSW
jgi:hypothetical protein